MPPPALLPISGKPDYTLIRHINNHLSTNAATFYRSKSRDNLGYLSLTEDPAVYSTLTSKAFSPPEEPPPKCLELAQDNPAAAQISENCTLWEESKWTYHQHHSVSALLHKQLLAAVNKVYVEELNKH